QSTAACRRAAVAARDQHANEQTATHAGPPRISWSGQPLAARPLRPSGESGGARPIRAPHAVLAGSWSVIGEHFELHGVGPGDHALRVDDAAGDLVMPG